MSESYVGEIRLFGFNFAPRNWALCNGQIMSIAQNSALFSLLGTTYGGNGVQTFALPDLRGRSALGFGAGPGLSYYAQGEVSGTETVTLVPGNLPAHAHPVVPPVATSSNTKNPSGAVPGLTTSSAYNATGSATGAMYATQSTGSSVPFDNRSPYLVLNYSICLYGIFPSRN